jgi:HAD superfamily hydrolase (TIGR01509 family)
MNIEFIYFDVGGVLILDFSGTKKWMEMTTAFGITDQNREEFDALFNNLEKEVCIGRDVESLVPVFKEKFNIKTLNNYSFLADFVNRFEYNASIHSLIKKVKQKYKIGLLTNMYPGMLNAIKAKSLLPEVEYDAVIDSAIEKCQKPEDKIFKIAEDKAKVSPNKILFVENSIKHIEAAKKRGWQTFLYDSKNPEESTKQLSELLII